MTRSLSDPNQQSLPRRGEKDFEPNPTILQADALASSRQAMHNAIAYPRLHNPKGNVIGIYCPEGVLVPPAVSDGEDEEKKATAAAVDGTGDEEGQSETKTKDGKPKPKRRYGPGGDSCVCIPSPKGGSFKSIGQADQWNRMWLLPEEALYLLERGSLDIRWPVGVGMGAATEGSAAATDLEAGIPMSMQAAYSLFLGRGGLTLERYTVFCGLRRGGYSVIRAPSWDASAESQQPSSTAQGSNTAVAVSKPCCASTVTNIFSRLFSWLHSPDPTCNTAHGPVTGLGIHRSYSKSLQLDFALTDRLTNATIGDIYRALSIIPCHDPTLPAPPVPPPTNAPYRLAFHVYKPSTTFRKSNPGPPEFQIAVVSARDNPTVPLLEDLGALLASTPYCPPHGEKMERLMYMRLRHGYRNVILAVVDQGVVSFLKISDSGFGREKLYNAKAPNSGNKGGGRRPPKKGKR